MFVKQILFGEFVDAHFRFGFVVQFYMDLSVFVYHYKDQQLIVRLVDLVYFNVFVDALRWLLNFLDP